ncbi:LysR family transcriptional regulator [Roseinatronobacter alkalisoli]|uniref:LysR family transcriptional regulator n=1 Tax=Roseinatronobacter alkalisoli TaxID=3028235 RepID=A0ABT5TFP5_9RHOB|nr:LysR family transcriptional regulator [Roseinatronobacter sp. HJB301]MDD7973490.1 LysR family transcriptional regulator [Roseinatronobacter sp. HJB301]
MDGLNLHRLQIFRTVFEMMSISAAARQMRLSQPTVSRHIAIFEDELSLGLFRNIAGRLEPTWEAQRLYAESGGLFERLGQLENSVESIQRGQQESLRLTASTVLAMTLVPSAVGALYARFPDLEIVVDGGRQKVQLAALRDGSIDMAIGGTQANRPDLRQTVIGEMPLVAVLPRRHPRAREKAFDLAWLAEGGCVMHNPRAPMGRLIIAQLDKRGITPGRQISALNIVFAVGLARAAGLCTVTDRLTAQAMAPDMRLLPLSEPIGLDLATIELANRPERRSTRAFCDELAKAFTRAMSVPLPV